MARRRFKSAKQFVDDEEPVNMADFDGTRSMLGITHERTKRLMSKGRRIF